jgi:hypothetical protein
LYEVFGIGFPDPRASPIFGGSLEGLPVIEGVGGEDAFVGFLAVVIEGGVGVVELPTLVFPAFILIELALV